MEAGEKFILCLIIFFFYLIPYVLDYGFDFNNGLNFLVAAGSIFSLGSLCEGSDYNDGVHNKTNCFRPKDVEENRLVWGIFSMLLTIMPGIAFALIRIFQFLNSQDQDGTKNKSALKLLVECLGLVALYPLYVVYVHLRSCYRVLTNGEPELSMLLNFGALEVVLESGPQVVLQLHTSITGFCPSVIQIFTMISSLLIIGKVAIEFHIGGDVFSMGFVEKNKKLLKLLPLFVTCIIFRYSDFLNICRFLLISRLGTLTILTTHLYWWIILPCFVSSVVVTVLASKNEYKLLSAIIAGPVNLFVLGTGMDLEQGFDRQWITKNRTNKDMHNQNQFYKQSTIFILIWNTLLLAGFLVAWTFVSYCDTRPIQHLSHTFEHWREKIFMREEIRSYGLYVVVGVIIFFGFLNALFLFIDTGEELDNVQCESSKRITSRQNTTVC